MVVVWILVIAALCFLLFFFAFGEKFQIKFSTKQWIKTSGLKRFLNFNTLHGYIYMRWQKEYLSFFINKIKPISIEPLRNWWANQYHTKVLTEEQAERLIVIEEDIPRQDLEQIVPYPKAREIILQATPKITIFECGCRNAREVHCEPTQVCMFIGDPFADFMAEHHPNESRRITQEEALTLLREEHDRGHVHSAWFKNAMADRFYALCNCCKCCCGGIELMNEFGTKMACSSGYVSEINQELCENCGSCVNACPFEAITSNGKTQVIYEKCMGCGVCVDLCPSGAISFTRDATKGIPLDVRLLEHNPN